MPTKMKRKPKAPPAPRRLRPLLDAAGITLNHLARQTGIGRGQLNKYDRGTVAPTWPSVLRMAKVLGLGPVVVADAFFEGGPADGN